jgi:hypothetical protein
VGCSRFEDPEEQMTEDQSVDTPLNLLRLVTDEKAALEATVIVEEGGQDGAKCPRKAKRQHNLLLP